MKTVTNHIGKFLAKLLNPILALMLTGMFLPSALAQSYPTSYWQFDDSANRGKDIAGGRDFSILGTHSYPAGLIGDAITYDGNGANRAERPVNDMVFDIGGSDFTMQVWVNYSTTAGEQVLLEKFSNPSGPGWTFYKGSGNNIEFYAQGIGVLGSGSLTIPTNVWHQTIARRSGNTFTLFFDGGLVASNTMTGAALPNPAPLLLGARGPAYGVPTSGLFDEVGFWKEALSDSDISSLWNGGAGLALVPEPSSVAMMCLGGLLFLRRRNAK